MLSCFYPLNSTANCAVVEMKKGSNLLLAFYEFVFQLCQVLFNKTIFIFSCFYPLNSTAYCAVVAYHEMSADILKCLSKKSIKGVKSTFDF